MQCGLQIIENNASGMLIQAAGNPCKTIFEGRSAPYPIDCLEADDKTSESYMYSMERKRVEENPRKSEEIVV